MPEVVEHHAGWQIRPDAEELVIALQSCLTNSPTANKELGRHGAKLVEERYSWPIVAAQMAELYTWVQGGPAPQSFPVQMS